MKTKRVFSAVLAVLLLFMAAPAQALEDEIKALNANTSDNQYFIQENTTLTATYYYYPGDNFSTGYALSLEGNSPSKDLERSKEITDSFADGISSILQNGYPCFWAEEYEDFGPMTDDELKYATAMAICAWAETKGMNGGVDINTVQPSAYPSLPEESRNLTITVDSNGKYDVDVKENVSLASLASYERAFMAFAYLYNKAFDAPKEYAGNVEIEKSGAWTPDGNEYFVSFAAKPTGDFTDIWARGLPEEAKIETSGGLDENGLVWFDITIPRDKIDEIEPYILIGHYLAETRFGIFTSGESGAHAIAFIDGSAGVLDTAEITKEKYQSRLTIKITDTASGAPIKDAKVEIFKKGTTELQTVLNTYPASGDSYTEYRLLPPGDYEFAITSLPTTYTLPEGKYSFTVGNTGEVTGQTTVSVNTNGNTTSGNEPPNTSERTNDTITVKHGTTPLAGVTITVYNQAGTATLSATSDTAGNISVASLPAGSYTYKLSAVPDTYAIDDQVRSLIVTDTAISGTLDITVSQAEFTVKKNNAANMAVSGVTYSLYDPNGALVTSVITDNNGIARFIGLKRGSYTIKETATVAGMLLSTDTHSFTVGADWKNPSTPYMWGTGGTNQESFAPTTRNTKTISLMHGSTPIVGATITVTNNAGTAVLSGTSSSNGMVDVSTLAVGSYSYRLTSVPETYAIDGQPHSFEITSSNTISGYIDLPVEKAIQIVKKKDGLAGVTYTLYNSSNNAVTSATTDSTGIAKFTGLTLGTFYIKETSNTTGDAVLEDKYEFTVTNAWINPKIAHSFTGDNLVSSATRQNKTIYVKAAGTTNPIAGVVITVYNSAGSSVLTATTNTYGVADVSALAAGGYTYKLTSVPSTYAIDGGAHAFSIDSTGYISGSIDIGVDKVEVEVKKVGKDKKTPIKGVTYTLYDVNNNAVTTAVTDEKGIATFSALVPGTYTIKETATVSDLALSSESYTFTVTNTWANGEPKVFYSGSTVQTGTVMHIFAVIAATSAFFGALYIIQKMYKKGSKDTV